MKPWKLEGGYLPFTRFCHPTQSGVHRVELLYCGVTDLSHVCICTWIWADNEAQYVVRPGSSTFQGHSDYTHQDKLSLQGGRKGVRRKKLHAAALTGPGLEPGTYRLLGESPQLHARDEISKPSCAYR